MNFEDQTLYVTYAAKEGKQGEGGGIILHPGRSHGSPGVITQPTMCYFSDDGRLYTFYNITSTVAAAAVAAAAAAAAVAAAAAAGIVRMYLSSPCQSGRHGPSGQAVRTAHHSRNPLFQLSIAFCLCGYTLLLSPGCQRLPTL